jgi:hypothetical protein
LWVMGKPDFEAIWIPRIGEKATRALRRYRWAGGTVPATMIVLGVAASYALDGDPTDKILGVALLAAAAGAFAVFIHSQRGLAAALTEWFGVDITGGGTPRMNPKRFDAWCRERGLNPSPRLRDGERLLWSRSGTVASSRERVARRMSIAGTLRVTTERIMFVPVRFGSIVIAMPRVHQFPISDFQLVGVSDHGSVTANAGDMAQTLGFTFQGGGS